MKPKVSMIGEVLSRRHAFSGAGALKTAILLVGLALAVVLAAPGRTVTSKYVNDLLIFLDGAYRIAGGQVPNVDFHSSLGPLSFYIPAVGYALTGMMSAAMPLGMALLTLAMAVVAAELIGSRMRATLGLPLAAFLLLVVAVPANPGEAVSELSFAMFYNRIGWAALGLLFVFALPRSAESPRRDGLDAVCAALLVLLMLYTKVTYGLVGLGFLLLILADPAATRRTVFALAIIALSVGGIELIWGGGFGYVEDLRLAGAVSGKFPTAARLFEVVGRNLPDLATFALTAGLVLWLSRSVRDFLFFGFCLGSGILIIEQNFQIVGILTLAAAISVASERVLRQASTANRQRIAASLPLLAGLLLLQPSAINLVNLGLHTTYAAARAGEEIPLPRYAGISLVPTMMPGAFDRFRRYNAAMADGRALLDTLDPPAERVAVMDFVNPFSGGMNLKPPRGDYPWYHWGRTIDRTNFPPAHEIFADADIVMQPKQPIERFTGNGMREIYADYLNAHFRQIADTKDWRVYRRLP